MSFPFSNACTPPSYTSVPIYKRDGDSGFFMTSTFSDCSDIALYSLFCCLLYSRNIGRYSTSHLPNASESLKHVFATYPVPLERIDLEIHMNWAKVIQDLDCAGIRYRKAERNELSTGLCNLLCVIVEVLGLLPEHREYLMDYMRGLKNEKELQAQHLEEFAAYVRDLFRYISVNDDVKVTFEGLTVQAPRGFKEERDIFGRITLVFPYPGNSHSVTLHLKSGHGKLELLPCKAPLEHGKREELLLLKAVCEAGNNFIGLLMGNCVQRFLDELHGVLIPCELIEEIFDSKNLNKFFMRKMIHSIKSKLYVLHLFLPYLIDEPVPPVSADAIVRFTSNIFGSVPLDDPATRNEFIRLLVFCENSVELYPRLEIGRNGDVILFNKIDLKYNSSLFRYMIRNKMPRLLLLYCIKYLDMQNSAYWYRLDFRKIIIGAPEGSITNTISHEILRFFMESNYVPGIQHFRMHIDWEDSTLFHKEA